MQKKITCFCCLILFTTINAIASPKICADVHMLTAIGTSEKGPHYYFIYLRTNAYDLDEMNIVYNINHDDPVLRKMKKIGLGADYRSNDIIVKRKQTLHYHFEYYYKNIPCSSAKFSFKPNN